MKRFHGVKIFRNEEFRAEWRKVMELKEMRLFVIIVAIKIDGVQIK